MAGMEKDEAASVEIAEAEGEAGEPIMEGGEATAVFEVIEAEVEEEVVANQPYRSSRRIEPHMAKLSP